MVTRTRHNVTFHTYIACHVLYQLVFVRTLKNEGSVYVLLNQLVFLAVEE